MWPPPALCVVPLNRTYTFAGEPGKRHTPVNVPDGAFAISHLFENPGAGEREPTRVFYRCIAAGYHIGDTPLFGHYVAIVRGSNGYAVANDANVLRGKAVEPKLRWAGRPAACNVAFVVLERVDCASAGRTPSELANNLTAAGKPARGWICDDNDCLYSNEPHATVCGGCAHWDARTLNSPMTTSLSLPRAACLGCLLSLRRAACLGCLALPALAACPRCLSPPLLYLHTATRCARPWPCPECTLLNPVDSHRCDACSASKTGTVSRWDCSKCTFTNNNAEVCEMCKSDRVKRKKRGR